MADFTTEKSTRLREVLAMRVYRQSNHSEKFAEEMALIEEIAELYKLQTKDENSRRALFEIFITVHEAGRIYGIRAERERRKYNREEAV